MISRSISVPVDARFGEPKTHLSRLLDRVAAGEEIILARAGTPVPATSSSSW